MTTGGTRGRFRPSANGYLHFGGAYIARQCYESALGKSGKFVLLVDDIVPVNKSAPADKPGARKQMAEYRDAFVRDLEWLGWGPDEVHMASEFHEAHVAAAAALGIEHRGFGELQHPDRYIRNCDQTWSTSQYSPWLVAGRVSDDYEAGVTEFWRGADLVTEAELYDYFSMRLYGDGRRVLQSYGAIIVDPEDSVCSKSDGTPGIADYREAGVTAEQVREALVWANMDDLGTIGQYGQQQHRYLRVRAELLQPAKAKRRGR